MSHCFPVNSHGVNDMNEEKNSDRKVKTDIYHAPLGKSFDNTLTSFEVFIRRQASCGFQLIVRSGILSASLLAGEAGFAMVSRPVAAED